MHEVKVGDVYDHASGCIVSVDEIHGGDLAVCSIEQGGVVCTVFFTIRDLLGANYRLRAAHAPVQGPIVSRGDLDKFLRVNGIDSERATIHAGSGEIRIRGMLPAAVMADLVSRVSMAVSVTEEPVDHDARQADYAAAAYRRSRGWR